MQVPDSVENDGDLDESPEERAKKAADRRAMMERSIQRDSEWRGPTARLSADALKEKVATCLKLIG